MKKIDNLIATKIIGVGAITVFLAIGVYTFILNLPSNKPPETVVVDNSDSNLNEPQNGLNNTNAPSATQTETAQTASPTPTQSTATTTPTNSGGGATTPTTPTAPTTPTTPTAPTPTYKYNNNNYTKSNTYNIPDEGLTWTLTATVTISNDTVTSVSTSQPTSGKSQSYYNNFSNNLTGAVVGKKIDTLNIGVIGGASYTSAAFNAILNLVRSSALK